MRTPHLSSSYRWIEAKWLGITFGLTALFAIVLLWVIQGMATPAAAYAASSTHPSSSNVENLSAKPVPNIALVASSAGERTYAHASSNPLETVTIRARAKGNIAEAGRITNLEEAVVRLNAQLEAEGADYRVVLDGELSSEAWPDYKQRLVDDFIAGQAPDIVLSGHEDVAPWGAADYIIPLSSYIDRDSSGTYSDFFPSLWDAVTWQGERWAVPQDTEARPVFFRKDVLRDLGWSDAEIEQMIADTRSGDFTLDDMVVVAEEAIQAGLVQWGLFHRPVEGLDFYILPLDYGGTLYNPATNHLVLSMCPMYLSLSFFHNLANRWQLTPPNMTTEISWGTAHQTFIDGDVLFWFGGTWQWAEWRDNYLGGDEQYLFDNVGYMLYPAARTGDDPLTLSHPLAYMISSQSTYPEIAFQILTLASAPDLVAQYSVDSAHLAVRQAAIQEPVYQNDAYLQSVSYMLDYTTFFPNHEQEGEYRTKLFEAISAVETDIMTPKTALTWLEIELQAALGSELEIVAPCFDIYLPLVTK